MSSEVRVSPQSGPFEGEERLGHILRLDISAFLVERGFRWGGGGFALFSSEKTQSRKGKKLLRDDFSPRAQGAQGLLEMFRAPKN